MLTDEQTKRAIWLRSQIEVQLRGDDDVDIDTMFKLLEDTDVLLHELILDKAAFDDPDYKDTP